MIAGPWGALRVSRFPEWLDDAASAVLALVAVWYACQAIASPEGGEFLQTLFQ